MRLLESGLQLAELVADLAELLGPEDYPGEHPTAVVLEMLCGSIATALEPVDLQEIVRGTKLIELAHDRAVEHVRLAAALSERLEGGAEAGGFGRG